MTAIKALILTLAVATASVQSSAVVQPKTCHTEDYIKCAAYITLCAFQCSSSPDYFTCMVECVIAEHHEECIDCISKEAQIMEELKASSSLKDDGCGPGFCDCNGCHTCQSCKLAQEALVPQRSVVAKNDGCGDGFCDCNGCHTCQSCKMAQELLVPKPKSLDTKTCHTEDYIKCAAYITLCAFQCSSSPDYFTCMVECIIAEHHEECIDCISRH